MEQLADRLPFDTKRAIKLAFEGLARGEAGGLPLAFDVYWRQAALDLALEGAHGDGSVAPRPSYKVLTDAIMRAHQIPVDAAGVLAARARDVLKSANHKAGHRGMGRDPRIEIHVCRRANGLVVSARRVP